MEGCLAENRAWISKNVKKETVRIKWEANNGGTLADSCKFVNGGFKNQDK